MKADSLDGRDRVIETYKEGLLKKTEIAGMHRICYETVCAWIKPYHETGSDESHKG